MRKKSGSAWRSILKRVFLVLVTGGLLLSVSAAYAQPYDLLLDGGHLIDPKNGIDEPMDVAIAGDSIAEIAPQISPGSAGRIIDVSGLYVTPGIIDMHTHVFHGTDPDAYIADAHVSVAPDGFTFRSGVTTVVDAGSAGWKNFRTLKAQTIDRADTRVLAFLNIVGVGMVGRYEEQNVADMNPEMTALMINELFPDILVGIKSAHYWGDFTQVERAVEAGNRAGVPVMVDFGEHDPPLSLETLLMDKLRPGDIFTHTYSYTRGREAVVDEEFNVKPYVFKAQERGVLFDVGHGGGSLIWHQVIPSMEQQFWPDVISSDLHTASMNGGMKNMANLMSKFLNMEMPLAEVILRSTWTPARVIGREDLGHLGRGAGADVAVFRLKEGDFGFLDARGRTMRGSRKLEAELTLRDGRVVWDLNGRAAPSWEEEPRRY
ncbi:amidohydrolase/deacetylase family metallohydrolase [Fodinibius sp.]|uniref:amidohydrolase/deacetylase family metallohydrolase n=1 Tax=Fodinibius sp. TaxID=1872440 RepID=UPI0035695F86